MHEADGTSEPLRADVDELLLFDDSDLAGDTFIFEPALSETHLGMLLVVAETAERGEVGRELIDTVVHAMQREYYRDARRGVLASFESALHQANLLLHDLVEQGVRDWMGSWHVAVGVLAGRTLHVSCAGEAVVLLIRGGRVTMISAGLSHSPITDPLRTFGQVASGVAAHRDVLFFGSSYFDQVFATPDLVRVVVDRRAERIALRLRQLYQDQRQTTPVGALVASVAAHEEPYREHELSEMTSRREAVSRVPRLRPRQPLVIHRSVFRHTLSLVGRSITYVWSKVRGTLWPLVKRGSQQGGKLMVTTSRQASRQVRRRLTRDDSPSEAAAHPETLGTRLAPLKRSVTAMPSLPKRGARRLMAGVRGLPLTSKVFAAVAVGLALALVVSVLLLQSKRAADQEFQYASELLHEARTKHEAAQTALIYDNRDQARELIGEAENLADQLAATGLYAEQIGEVRANVSAVRDRLAKVTRVASEAARVVGSFDTAMADATPTHLFYLQGNLYTYHPKTNVVVRMTLEGAVDIVSDTTQGVGFFQDGVAHEADKTLVLLTSDPGVALYDAKTELVQKQEFDPPSSEPVLLSAAVFGSRLYVYDRGAANIYVFGKTLRGYAGGAPWITEEDFPRETISSIAVDGFIYTLHEDGTARKLFKGAPVDDFTLETIDPPLTREARLFKTEELRNLYIFDPSHKRVVIFDGTGALEQQLFLGDDTVPADIAIDPKEEFVYVLEDKQVRSVPLNADSR